MIKPNSINERLDIVMKHFGIQQGYFSEISGLSSSTVSRIMHGHSVNIDLVTSILRQWPDMSAEWLVRGEGEMFRDTRQVERPTYNRIRISHTIEKISTGIDTNTVVLQELREDLHELRTIVEKSEGK